jgi:trimeric autotransporter adhesin
MRRNPRQFVLAAIPAVCILLLAACGSCPPVLRYITISPTSASIGVGGTAQFSAQAYYSNGSITSATGLVLWTSSAPAVATVNSSGLVTGVSLGTATITASAAGTGGATATVTVVTPGPVSLSVTPASPTIAIGNSLALVATENWNDGTTGHTPSGTVTWASGTATTANVVSSLTNGTGLVSGIATGAATITATEGSLTPGSSDVTVVTGSAQYGYISNVGSANIGSYTVSTTASPYLTPLATFATPSAPFQSVIHPSGAYMYYTDMSSNIYVAGIAPTTGALSTPTGMTPIVAGGGGINFTVVDPYGRFVYVADDGSGTGPSSGTIYGFVVNQTTGLLTPITGVSAYTTNLASPQCLIIDRTGSYLYATNYNATPPTISQYSINPTTGALTPLSPASVTLTTSPVLATLDPAGAHLYTANSNNLSGTATTPVNSISSFSIGTNGALTSLGADVTISGATFTFNLVVDPADAHIYVVDNGPVVGTGQVFGYAVGSGGVIGSAITGTPIPTGPAPLGSIIIDPTGTLMAVDNSVAVSPSLDSTISLYLIGSNGQLTSETPVAAGTAPSYYVIFYNAP